MFNFTREVQIVSHTAAGTLDEYGNAKNVVGTISTVGELQQVRREEQPAGGEISRTTWNLYLPIDAVVDTTDTVIIDGREYDLVGEPWYADTGSTDVHHIEASVVRAA